MSDLEFPHAIDSSMRSAFVSCPQKFMRQYLEHWALRNRSVHLTAGGAFARGLEVARRAFWESRIGSDESLAKGALALLHEYGEPQEDFMASAKTPDTMLIALDDYFREYGWETDSIQPLRTADGKFAFEFTFALEIPGIDHPVTGDPMLYTGRFDMLGTFNNSLWVVDEKTSSQLGPSWANQWRLRSQITGYCWAAAQYGHAVSGALIRGVSVQKSGIKHGLAIEYRPQWQIDRWLFQLKRDVTRMVSCWREGYWDFALDHACADFGGCPFVQVCTSNNPERWLSENYEKHHWNPLRNISEN